MIYDTRRREEAHTEERIGNPTASRRVAALRLNLSTKEDLPRKCGPLFVFTGERSGAVSVLFSDPVLEEKFRLALRCLTLLSFFLLACVCVSLNLLFSIMLLGF